MEMITDNPAIESAGFYWRERDDVRALICAPLEQDGFTNAFSTRGGGVSPFPRDALNLAGFNEDEAENIYENRRRFLKLFEGVWTLAGCWQIHGADIRVVHDPQEAKPKPGVLGDDQYCDALVSNTPKILLAVKTADCVPILMGDPVTRSFAAVHAGGAVPGVCQRADGSDLGAHAHPGVRRQQVELPRGRHDPDGVRGPPESPLRSAGVPADHRPV